MSKPALTAKRLIVDQFREHYFALTHPWTVRDLALPQLRLLLSTEKELTQLFGAARRELERRHEEQHRAWTAAQAMKTYGAIRLWSQALIKRGWSRSERLADEKLLQMIGQVNRQSPKNASRG